MNSKMLKGTAMIAVIALVQNVQAVDLEHKLSHQAQHRSEGIFGRMIDQVTAPERLAEEKHEATMRKEQQLAEAEKDYQSEVQQEEMEEALKKKKEEEEAEAQAIEAAKNSPQAKMLTAANDAASSINMAEMEASIQANLQAKIDAGASKAEILAGAGTDDLSSPANSLALATGSFGTANAAQSVVSKVLAGHGIAARAAAAPVAVAPIAQPALSLAQPADVAITTTNAETKASQEKVKEMAHKLGIPFTADLVALGTNAAISNALIEKAVAAGKSEAEIDAAMSTL